MRSRRHSRFVQQAFPHDPPAANRLPVPSLVRLGHLPKHNDRSSRAWLHGKLLVALLTQKMIRIGRNMSPLKMYFPSFDNH